MTAPALFFAVAVAAAADADADADAFVMVVVGAKDVCRCCGYG